jgi:hypothetical protein
MSLGGCAGDGSVQRLVLDASTIINLIDSRAWPNVLRLTGFSFSTTPIVLIETQRRDHRKKPLREALASNLLIQVDVEIPPFLLNLFSDVRKSHGAGDASVLLNAKILGYGIGADDRGLGNLARREGVEPVLTTELLLVEMVRQSLQSVSQANRKLRELKGYRFPSGMTCLCHLCGVPCACPIAQDPDI